MVLYNNILALPTLLLLCLFNGELSSLHSNIALKSPAFLAAAGASAVIACGISFSSLWFLSTTTATTYCMVGSLSKVPTAILGLVFFKTPCTPKNLASVGVGLVASGIFVLAKKTPTTLVPDRGKSHLICFRTLDAVPAQSP